MDPAKRTTKAKDRRQRPDDQTADRRPGAEDGVGREEEQKAQNPTAETVFNLNLKPQPAALRAALATCPLLLPAGAAPAGPVFTSF